MLELELDKLQCYAKSSQILWVCAILGHESWRPSLGHPLKLMWGAAGDSLCLVSIFKPIHICHAGWHYYGDLNSSVIYL